jgi:hypothetical protein
MYVNQKRYFIYGSIEPARSPAPEFDEAEINRGRKTCEECDSNKQADFQQRNVNESRNNEEHKELAGQIDGPRFGAVLLLTAD